MVELVVSPKRLFLEVYVSQILDVKDYENR